VVEPNGIRLPVIPTPLGDLGNGLGVSEEKFVKNWDVVRVDAEFAADRPYLLHGRSISKKEFNVNRSRRFLPGLKSGVSAPRFL
jgi:hypothetical protein